jgi:hypothetical protein
MHQMPESPPGWAQQPCRNVDLMDSWSAFWAVRLMSWVWPANKCKRVYRQERQQAYPTQSIYAGRVQLLCVGQLVGFGSRDYAPAIADQLAAHDISQNAIITTTCLMSAAADQLSGGLAQQRGNQPSDRCGQNIYQFRWTMNTFDGALLTVGRQCPAAQRVSLMRSL